MSAVVPAKPHFSFRRIGALIRRHWYLLRGSWPRLFDLVYWPTVQLATWGFLQLYLTKRADVAAAAAGALIGGVLLWDILFRGQLGF
jgi:ABC-2 type transport system permease protein